VHTRQPLPQLEQQRAESARCRRRPLRQHQRSPPAHVNSERRQPGASRLPLAALRQPEDDRARPVHRARVGQKVSPPQLGEFVAGVPAVGGHGDETTAESVEGELDLWQQGYQQGNGVQHTKKANAYTKKYNKIKKLGSAHKMIFFISRKSRVRTSYKI